MCRRLGDTRTLNFASIEGVILVGALEAPLREFAFWLKFDDETGYDILLPKYRALLYYCS
jgi:hypothetical protein